jgi:hypothetical protein
VVFYPNDRRFEIMFPAAGAPSSEPAIARFDLNEMLSKEVAAGN